MNSPAEVPVIAGPGLFDIEVESDLSDNFITRYGTQCADDGSVVLLARLKLDDMGPSNPMAVAVFVDDHPVGYLPAAIALDFRRAVIDGGLNEYTVFECKARIYLGSCAGRTDYGTSRIWLDLPQDDESEQLTHPKVSPTDDPRIPIYRHTAVADRQIDELIGIVKGVMADGMVTQGEVDFLLRWMETNRHAANLWPAKVLYPRLAHVAARGFMSLHEEGELLDLLMKTVGGNTAPQSGFASNSTKLPLTEPMNRLSFEGRGFCFTGTFHSGTRDWCHSQVEVRGGRCTASITKKLHYLIIGDIGNETWAHSTHGRKIEKAIQYNSTGCNIEIISEEHWYSHL